MKGKEGKGREGKGSEGKERKGKSEYKKWKAIEIHLIAKSDQH